MNAKDGNPSGREIEIAQCAALWWALRQDPEAWTLADEAALAEWLSRESGHWRAYAQAEATWMKAADIAPINVQGRVTAAQTSRRCRGRVRRMARLGAVAAGAWLVIFVCVVGMERWQHTLPEPIVAISDDRIAQVTLPDGTGVELNRNTRIRFEQTRDLRKLFLERGEALLQVPRHSGLPFVVDVGRVQVRVVGTVFNVRRTSAKVMVDVQQGEVELQDVLDSGRVMSRLRAGRAASVEQSSGRLQLRSIGTNSVATWRSGQLRFRDTRLEDAADELSAYLPGITLRVNPGVGGLPVSGYASVSDPEAFIDALPCLLPVQVKRDPDGNILVIPADQGSLSREKPLSRG